MRRKLQKSLIIILVFFSFAGYAQQNDDFKIALALKGGGALGFAHIGAIEVIDSLGVPIDYVAGTSMGGLVGALYSLGYSADEMKKFVLSINWKDLFNDSPPRSELPYLVKKNTGKFQVKLDLDYLKPKLPSGLISGQKIYELFFKTSYFYEGVKSFDDLPIPFRCVGADLVTMKEVDFDKGSLALAMRSTMSIPTVFNPVRIGDKMIVDGGMINNYPVDVAKNMGADFVIGLNLVSKPKDADYFDDLLKVLDRTSDIPRYQKLQSTVNLADLNIDENIEGYSLQDFDVEKVKEIIARGKKAAYEKLDELIAIKKEYLKHHPQNVNLPKIKSIEVKGNNELSSVRIKRMLKIKEGGFFDVNEYKKRLEKINNSSHLFSIASKEIKKENGTEIRLAVTERKIAIINKLKVNSKGIKDEKFIIDQLQLREGKPFYVDKFQKNVSRLYGLDYYKYIIYSIKQNKDSSIDLTIQAEEKSPHRFLFGIKYNDFNKLVGNIGFQVNSVLVPGLYLETELQFSGLTRLKFLAAYPSTSLSSPLYPFVTVDYKEIPYTIYDQEGNGIIKYWERAWYFQAGLGLEIDRSYLLSAAIKYEIPNVKEAIGAIAGEFFNSNYLSLRTGLIIDKLDSRLFPSNGLYFRGGLEWSSEGFASDFYFLRLEGNIDFYATIDKIHTFHIGGLYRQSWSEEQGFMYKTWFLVGGPETFWGWEYWQAIGFRFFTALAEYRAQVAEGLYLAFRTNAAFDSDFLVNSNKKVLWGGGVAVIYNSLFGPVSIIITNGDKSPYSPTKRVMRYYFQAGYRF
ncbi:MAG: BamA/TamA family outer membrane protein [Chlorobi bacterium]|nr:BamA/TamA family outer membrane protein [Chlorobiota bacterium]